MGANQSSKYSTPGPHQEVGRRNSLGGEDLHSGSKPSKQRKKLTHSLRLKFRSKSKNLDLNGTVGSMGGAHQNGNLSGNIRSVNCSRANEYVLPQHQDKAFGLQNYISAAANSTTLQQQQQQQYEHHNNNGNNYGAAGGNRQQQRPTLGARQRPGLFGTALLGPTPADLGRRNESSNNYNCELANGSTLNADNYYFAGAEFCGQQHEQRQQREQRQRQQQSEKTELKQHRQQQQQQVVDEFDGSFSSNDGNVPDSSSSSGSSRCKLKQQHPGRARASKLLIASNGNNGIDIGAANGIYIGPDASGTRANVSMPMGRAPIGDHSNLHPQQQRYQANSQQQVPYQYQYQRQQQLQASPNNYNSPIQLANHHHQQRQQFPRGHSENQSQLYRPTSYGLEYDDELDSRQFNRQQQQQPSYLSQQHGAIDFHRASHLNSNNSSYFNCNNNNTSFPNFEPSHMQARSKTLENLSKQSALMNPMTSIFNLHKTTSGIQNRRQHSNTIHLGRREKSAGQLQNQASGQELRPISFSNSLKRIKSSPLSAQQASYEAMRTIDLYLIRQIARSCMDFEMEQKIDLEIRLRELAAQSLLEARNEIDILEVEKSLLTSDQRMNHYAIQLEQQRKQLSNPSLSTDSGRGSKSGQMSLSRRSINKQLSTGGSPNNAGTNQQEANNNNNSKQIPSDVIGGPMITGVQNDQTSSPSCFSSIISNSHSPNSNSSPSKLSPVSGQSANSPSFTTQSSHHSRTGALRHSQSSKSLLMSSKEKAKSKRHEQMMQNITSLSNINCNMVLKNMASLSVSELRIPLMWRDVDHFKQRGDYKRYAIFCLLKINSQIYDTQLISDVDRHKTDVTFDDLVIFNEVDYDFELCLEVYSCVYLEEFSLSSTPRKLKEKLTSSVSKAMGKRLLTTQTASANYTKELQAYDRSYRFSMIASAILKLKDASNSVKTYDLVLVSPSAHHRNHQMTTNENQYASHQNKTESDKNTLPLFGHFCCKLLVVPDVFDKNIKTGFLKIATIDTVPESSTTSPTNPSIESESSPDQQKLNRTSTLLSNRSSALTISNASIHYSFLRNFHLHLWLIDENRLAVALAKNQPLPQFDNLHKSTAPLVITINKYTRLLKVSNTSLTLDTEKGCFIISAYCSSTGQLNQAAEMGHWLRAIEQAIYDSHIWGSTLNHLPRAKTMNNNSSMTSIGGHDRNNLHDNDEMNSSMLSGSRQSFPRKIKHLM